jgi:hypothetical protein
LDLRDPKMFLIRNYIICNINKMSDIKAIKSKKFERAGHIVCVGEMRNAHRPFGGSRLTQAHNINMDLKEIAFAGVDGIHVAQDRDQYET